MNILLIYNPHKNIILDFVKYKHIVVSVRVRGCGHVSIHVTLSIYIYIYIVFLKTRTYGPYLPIFIYDGELYIVRLNKQIHGLFAPYNV